MIDSAAAETTVLLRGCSAEPVTLRNAWKGSSDGPGIDLWTINDF